MKQLNFTSNEGSKLISRSNGLRFPNFRILSFLFTLLAAGILNFSAQAQVFCIGSSLAGNITGYTGVFQAMPSVAAGQAYYWTTTLTAGIPYTWSNCPAQGGTSSDTYLRIYNAANAIVASADDICGANPTVTYTPTVSGLYYVHLAQYSCGNLSTSQIISYMAVLPPAPTIASFLPSSGCSGSTPVVITGANFTNVSAVTFGGTAAQSYVVNSPTQITAIPANGTTGTIAVTTPGGTATSVGTFTVNLSPAAPTLTAATPNSICLGASSTLSTVPPTGTITVFTEDFANNNQGWTLGTEWQIGPAVAGGTTDPGVDHTPTVDNGIAGAVIGGNITTAVHPYYYITSPVINLSGLTTANLDFWRWLSSDYPNFMNSTIDVWNGSTWVNIFTMTAGVGIMDAAWTFQTFNITPHINANFQVRWGHNIGQAGAFTRGGWNIDDITISGNGTLPIMWTGPAVIANPTAASTNVTPGVSGANTYTVTATSGNGCTSSASTLLVVNAISAPPVATANPATICPGGTSQLVSTGTAGSTQYWFDAPVGGNALGTSLSGANFPVSPGATTTYYVETIESTPPGSQTFNFTGAMQTFTVPAGVTSITINAYGSQGVGMNGFLPGNGGRAQGVMAVSPGQVLNVFVGGTNGYNGGGIGQGGANGGGASDVRAGGVALGDRVIVAGGGGGAGGDNWNCNVGTGHGGGGIAVGANFVGGAGGAGYTPGTGCGTDGGNAGGTGGSGTHGGGGGGGGLISGGTGATSTVPGTGGTGTLGQGGASFNAPGCGNTGGGGGGYYGGGGAAGNNCGAGRGGGGSSWTGALTSPLFQPGVQTGNGQVVISWTGGTLCPSTPRVAVTVTVVSPVTATIVQSPAGLLCGTNPTLTASATGGGTAVPPPAGARYYVRNTEPWGSTTNIDEMTAVFGLGNYTTTNYAGANPATVFVPGTQFVFLEGSDGNEVALNAYITANITTIENWVSAGGRLFLNAAPQSGTNMAWGFGGVTCVYPGAFESNVTANGAHPIVLGPNLPTGTAYTGSSFAHANITNGGTILIADVNAVLTEKTWGNGLALFGGMTTTNWHGPVPNATNLRRNILNYTATAPASLAYTYLWQPGGATTASITAPATGVYTVTVTSPLGCTSTSTISVTINPAVTVSASASPAAICSGASTTLTATGVATNYDWQPGALTGAVVAVSPVANTVYTVTASDPSGCTSVATVAVTVNPAGGVSGTTATPGTICEGSTSQLQTVPAANPNNYIVTSIPYAPVTPTGPTGAGPASDDATTLPLPIGFTFNFYGTNYSTFVISSNGFISFNPLAGNGCCNGMPLPTAGDPDDLVALAWNDLNPGAGGSIEYYNLTSPNRMVIQFNNVPHFGGGGTPVTGQIILYENGNIETHTASVNSDGSDQTLGVENSTGLFGTPAPGRNASVWGATNESWLFSPDVSAVSWSPAGSLNNATIVNPVATPSSTTVYTVTATNGYGCTATQTVEVIVNPAPPVSASATPNTTCNNTSVTPNATGATTYVWSGGLTNGVPFVATATTIYTVTGTDGIGCSATSTVQVTVNPASGGLAPTTSNQTQSHDDDFDIDYYNGLCDLIATVDDGAGGNILGLTTATVNVDATAGFHNTQPFVRRWYQITPANNGSADVVLYVNQSDFDDYNTVVLPPYLPLPTTGNNADPNIANIRITKNDDAGLGSNPIVITPTVNWNGTYWELSFNTPSFSQFRVHGANPGNVPLPVTVLNFSGKKLDNSDELSWTTGSEQNNAYFNLQHSTDGISFKTIAKVETKAANGNSGTALNYNAVNPKPVLGHNYYRLQQVDVDNKSSIHAQIVDLIWGSNGSTVNIYPNPTRDVLNIDLYTTQVQNTTVKVLDMSGRIIKQVQAKSIAGMNNISISLGEVASGLYTVQVYENDKLTHTGKVRKND